MGDQDNRLTRVRYTATGALAALVAAGAIAAGVALADAPSAQKTGNPASSSGLAKPVRPSCASAADAQGTAPDKTRAPQPGGVPQAFFDTVQRLVDNGTITAAQGQAVDAAIRTGRIDSDTLASSGFTRTPLRALQQALANTKRGLAAAAPPAAG